MAWRRTRSSEPRGPPPLAARSSRPRGTQPRGPPAASAARHPHRPVRPRRRHRRGVPPLRVDRAARRELRDRRHAAGHRRGRHPPLDGARPTRSASSSIGLPIERLSHLHRDDDLHRRMMIEGACSAPPRSTSTAIPGTSVPSASGTSTAATGRRGSAGPRHPTARSVKPASAPSPAIETAGTDAACTGIEFVDGPRRQAGRRASRRRGPSARGRTSRPRRSPTRSPPRRAGSRS